ASDYDRGRVAAAFGEDVATLVDGVTRMSSVHALAVGADAQQRAVHAEKPRKMLLAMVGDIRVVLIKLAERTQALRYLMGTAQGDPRASAGREVGVVDAPPEQ